MAQQVRLNSASDTVNFAAVKQATMAIGNSKRAMRVSETNKERSNRGDAQKGTRCTVKPVTIVM